MRVMRRTRRAVGRGIAAAILGAVLASCATGSFPPPRVMKADDFKLLAGDWLGTSYVEQEAPVAIQGRIQENGAFYTVARSSPGAQVSGFMRIVDGGVVYEGPASKGTMTFHEMSTEWIWKWQGETRIGNRRVTNELRKSK